MILSNRYISAEIKDAPSPPYNNNGGGNVYDLRDLTSGSGNLVGVNEFGTGGTHAALSGTGGLGVTCLWTNNNVIGDNGNLGEYDGNTYTVNGHDGEPFYQVTKDWTLDDRTLTLDITATMLRDASIAEPRVSFNFHRDRWFRAELTRHTMLWPNNNCTGADGHNNPDNEVLEFALTDLALDDACYRVEHSQKLKLVGVNNNLTLTINPDNGGFEGGGMFTYGLLKWGRFDNHMSSEFALGVCGRRVLPSGAWNVPLDVAGAIDLHWFGWWGGNPPAANRYKNAMTGDVFIDDKFVIEVEPYGFLGVD